MAAPLPPALRVFGMGKRRLRELLEWAEDEPAAAASGLRVSASFCEHRHRVLARRKRVFWRRQHRLNRLRSAQKELEELAEMYDEKANADTEPIRVDD